MTFQNFVNGVFVPAANGQILSKIDPSTGLAQSEVADSGLLDVVRAVQAGNKAYTTWSKTTSTERAALLEQLAQLIDQRAQDFALACARDLGTPISQTLKTSVPEAVEHLRFHAQRLRDEPSSSKTEVRHSIGLIGLITPASEPLVCMTSRLAAIWAQGNVAILKPSRNTPETAVLLAQLANEAGLPAGSLAVLLGRGEQVGEILVQHPGISTLSFMGSTPTGRKVNQLASEDLKQIHLSLGAKNSALVFAGVDLDIVIPKVVSVCVGLFPSRAYQGSRLFIQESIFKQALERLKQEFDSLRVGSAFESSTHVGPLPTPSALKNFDDAVRLAKKENGKFLTTSHVESGGGFFVNPVLFADLTNCSTLQQDEILGPLVLASSFKYQHEALKHANISPYGRAGYIFESDAEKAEKVANRFETGQIFLNADHARLSPERKRPLLKASGNLGEGPLELAQFFSRSTEVSLN